MTPGATFVGVFVLSWLMIEGIGLLAFRNSLWGEPEGFQPFVLVVSALVATGFSFV